MMHKQSYWHLLCDGNDWVMMVGLVSLSGLLRSATEGEWRRMEQVRKFSTAARPHQSRQSIIKLKGQKHVSECKLDTATWRGVI